MVARARGGRVTDPDPLLALLDEVARPGQSRLRYCVLRWRIRRRLARERREVSAMHRRSRKAV